MKKIIKNKYVIIVFCILITSIIYLKMKKTNNNENIIYTEEEVEQNSNDEKIMYTDEEIDLEIEELEENSENGEGQEDEEIESEVDDTNNSGNVKSKIYIHITGEVNNPGVVTLDEGSRIVDAINAAGGTTSNADISKINLVYILEDGMKINIPDNSELKENINYEYITKGSGDGKVTENDGSDYKNESSKSSNSAKYSIVNINSATQTELESLPGIGPSLALKIINYRKENGRFSSIEEIKEVSGIGEAKYNELKKYITI